MNHLKYLAIFIIVGIIDAIFGPAIRKNQQKRWERLSPEKKAEILERERKRQEERQKRARIAFGLLVLAIAFFVLGSVLIVHWQVSEGFICCIVCILLLNYITNPHHRYRIWERKASVFTWKIREIQADYKPENRIPFPDGFQIIWYCVRLLTGPGFFAQRREPGSAGLSPAKGEARTKRNRAASAGKAGAALLCRKITKQPENSRKTP